jgi:hypothetical protein
LIGLSKAARQARMYTALESSVLYEIFFGIMYAYQMAPYRCCLNYESIFVETDIMTNGLLKIAQM